MNTYLLFKSIHLIAVVSWMVGLLYLPRIFVNHAENIENENSSNILCIEPIAENYFILNN